MTEWLSSEAVTNSLHSHLFVNNFLHNLRANEKQTRNASMEFQKIRSGKDKTQILDKGFRFQWNKGPNGINEITYFTCTTKGCKATLATFGKLDGELTLKYHNIEKHEHEPDAHANIVSASLHKFRERIRTNPESSAKAVYEEIATDAIQSIETPNKHDLAKKLPTYRNGKHHAIFFFSSNIFNLTCDGRTNGRTHALINARTHLKTSNRQIDGWTDVILSTNILNIIFK